MAFGNGNISTPLYAKENRGGVLLSDEEFSKTVEQFYEATLLLDRSMSIEALQDMGYSSEEIEEYLTAIDGKPTDEELYNMAKEMEVSRDDLVGG